MAKTVSTLYKKYPMTPLNTLDISDLAVILPSPLAKHYLNHLWGGLVIHIPLPDAEAQPAATALQIFQCLIVSGTGNCLSQAFFLPSSSSTGFSEQ